MRLDNKVAYITGAGSGIGKETALLFSEKGASVVLADINKENLNSVKKEIEDLGGKALVVEVDVTNRESIEKSLDKTIKEFDKIDILINNAGINMDSLTVKMKEDKWDKVLNVNLKGTFNCCQIIGKHMIEKESGKIVNTASIGALGNIGQANYSASKAGVIGLTKTLSLEFARYNINVNCISPGATETQMTAGIPDKVKDFLIKKIPLRKFAEPKEIAKAHLFMASDYSNYVTGQVLFVDGGISIGI